MRTLIISDVHSNIEALTTVIADAEAGGAVGAIWCTGDLVGYGPDPVAVIALLRESKTIAVAGNHDLVACGQMGVEEFNPVAAEAALWTRDQLTPDEQAYLAGLPLVHTEGAFTLVHGSLRHPDWEYLLTPEQALDQFALQTTPHSIVGHSHLSFYVNESQPPLFLRARDRDTVALETTRLILNPGSSGQPRDGDPRASYMLYDDAAATVTWHRVAYDIAATQRKILATGLPAWLGERLEKGK